MTFRLWLATVAALICGSQADAQNKVRTETIRPSVTANPAGKPNAHATPPDAHNAAGVPDIVTDLSQLPAPVARTRERILAHQEQPQCASCHRKIDPIGFGLETFDGIGRARTRENGAPIDTRGELDGTAFDERRRPRGSCGGILDAATAMRHAAGFAVVV